MWQHNRQDVASRRGTFVRCVSCGAQSPRGDAEARALWWADHTKLKEKRRGVTQNAPHVVDPLG